MDSVAIIYLLIGAGCFLCGIFAGIWLEASEMKRLEALERTGDTAAMVQHPLDCPYFWP